jgi:hypothetical protein
VPTPSVQAVARLPPLTTIVQRGVSAGQSCVTTLHEPASTAGAASYSSCVDGDPSAAPGAGVLLSLQATITTIP